MRDTISISPFHISIKLKKCIIIGIYYKPSLDIDDRINDLINCLESAREKFPKYPIIIGGDFNMHFGSDDFNNLQEILDLHYDIVLTSNPEIPTFLGNRGEPTTPDHIFCSRNLKIKRFSVPERIESDHQPLVLELGIPALKTDIPYRTELNLEACLLELEKLNAELENTSFSEITEQLHSILLNCQDNMPLADNRSHRIQILKEETKDAFQLMQMYKNEFFRDIYRKCRKQLHREIAINKRRIKERHVQKIIEVGKSQGIRSLYKYGKLKTQSDSSTLSLKQLYDHCFDLYQSYDEPVFKKYISVPTKSAIELLKPISNEEIYKTIAHQGSSAKSYNGTSPTDFKKLNAVISPILKRIFNEILLKGEQFPEKWLTTVFFFLHKKGSYEDPANYRSLAIEDPILKIFTGIICNRLSEYCEENDLLPTYQFGFRRHFSTTSATSLLKLCVEETFSKKKKLYVSFIDYKKAFDLTDRSMLCEKLHKLGVPTSFVGLIYELLTGLQFRVRSGGVMSPSFYSFNGVPQGDPLSPLLYSIYTHDFPDILQHEGVKVAGCNIKYLLYADDLVLISSTPGGLQNALCRLESYTRKNKLIVNILKTKCMIFYRGYLQKPNFFFENHKLEMCNNFTYLGVVFTTRLSASKHVDHIISKCNAKVGYLFATLALKEMPFAVAMDVFNTYILPIITYAIAVWLPLMTESLQTKLNTIYTKFLKRYLGLPYSANNAIVYFITETCPLNIILESKILKATLKVTYPTTLEGTNIKLPQEQKVLYSPIENIPTHFWLSTPLKGGLPISPEPRRALLYMIMDLIHSHICETNEFHLNPDSESCKCKFCGKTAEYYIILEIVYN